MAQRDRPVVVQQVNALPQVHPTLGYTPYTSTHLHGSPSLPEYDGYASDVTQPGQWKNYHYPNNHPACTFWYHDHAVDITAENAYFGLAAQYQLHDALEQSLGLPSGAYDVPLIIRDAMFAADGSLIFDDNDHSGLFGDVILVNGKPWPAMRVERRKYRFRMLNASVSRSYRLRLLDRRAVHDHRRRRRAGAGAAAGRRLPLRDGRALRDDHRLREVPDRHSASCCRTCSPRTTSTSPTPTRSWRSTSSPSRRRSTATRSRISSTPTAPTMALTRGRRRHDAPVRVQAQDGQWTINGHTWADVIASDFTLARGHPGFNDVEIWEFKNNSGGWFHPVHIHLIDFKILDRNGRPPFDYETAPKDVVYVGEDETVRVIIAVRARRSGRYMMHCHNLVHEDHDMMVQFEVGTGGSRPDHDRSCPQRPGPGGLGSRNEPGRSARLRLPFQRSGPSDLLVDAPSPKRFLEGRLASIHLRGAASQSRVRGRRGARAEARSPQGEQSGVPVEAVHSSGSPQARSTRAAPDCCCHSSGSPARPAGAAPTGSGRVGCRRRSAVPFVEAARVVARPHGCDDRLSTA